MSKEDRKRWKGKGVKRFDKEMEKIKTFCEKWRRENRKTKGAVGVPLPLVFQNAIFTKILLISVLLD